MRLAPEANGMTLSTCMLVLPLYHPLHVAAQLALVDAACGGQAILGVSPGWQEDEFRIMGLEHKARISRFVESVELIKRLFIEDSVTFDGRHFCVEDLTLALKPVRKPRPPFWFGGSVEKAVARAARLADTSLGDTWVASSHLTRDVIVEQASVFRNTLAGLGKDTPDDFPLLRNVVVALTSLQDLAERLAADDLAVVAAFDDRFDEALAIAADLDDPVFAGTAKPQSRLRVEVLQQSVAAIRDVARQDLGPHLGVASGFIALDGD